MKAWNKKTNEDFLKDLHERGIKYKPIDEYADSHTKIRFECPICRNVFEMSPTNILSGKGCKFCKIENAKKNFRRTHSQFLKDVEIKNPNIEIMGTYQGDYFPIMVRCKKHNRLYMQTPAVVLKGCGCDKCMKEKISIKNRSDVEYFKKLAEENSPFLEVLHPEKYKNAKTKMEVKCVIHGNTFLAFADPISRGTAGCPICSMSNGEHEVALFLDNNGYDYITQYIPENGKLGRKRFDFYIPEQNTIIEYDGAQHYLPIKNWGGEDGLEQRKLTDEMKTNYCVEEGIKLIRIPYTTKNVGEYLKASGL